MHHIEHVSESLDAACTYVPPLQDFPKSGCIHDKLNMGNAAVDD